MYTYLQVEEEEEEDGVRIAFDPAPRGEIFRLASLQARITIRESISSSVI